MRRFLIILALFSTGLVQAQELNCQVQILTRQVSNADASVFEAMETAIYEFMNNTKWTDKVYREEEKINCNIVLNITSEVSLEEFGAQLTIQSSRPVFNTGYESVLFNHLDNDVQFEFTPFEPLEFNENAHLNNLTSILAYYAYLIIGLDDDSFESLGGSLEFLKAQTIVNNAQTATERGWKRLENNNNRYWIIENILNPRFADMRKCYYDYHLKALDQVYEKQITLTPAFTSVLRRIEAVNRSNPNSMFVRIFMNAKSEELMNIYSKAQPAEKTIAVNLMSRLDPSNSNKYQELLKN